MATTARRSGGLIWLVLALCAFAVAAMVVAAPSRHAIVKHGGAAWRVTQRLGDADPGDDDTWSEVCQDGHRYTFRRTPDGAAYDVSIDTPDLRANLTRFTTRDLDWVARKLAWCVAR